MKQTQKILILILTTLLISNSNTFANPVIIQKNPINQFPRADLSALAPFSSIEADGDFNIYITGGNNRSVVLDNDANEYVNAEVIDNKLVLNVPVYPEEKNIVFPPATVRITVPYVEALYLNGHSSVIGNNIRSYGLTIVSDEDSNIVLNGVVGVNKITASGDSNISISWVDSKNLEVLLSGCARVYLAGVTDLLQARLAGASHLNAKYLRPRVMLIQTQDQAVAEVLAIKYLYAFATGQSNIYYFKTPDKNYLESTEFSGNSLQLGHWQ